MSHEIDATALNEMTNLRRGGKLSSSLETTATKRSFGQLGLQTRNNNHTNGEIKSTRSPSIKLAENLDVENAFHCVCLVHRESIASYINISYLGSFILIVRGWKWLDIVLEIDWFGCDDWTVALHQIYYWRIDGRRISPTLPLVDVNW